MPVPDSVNAETDMQTDETVTYLREMAVRCRRLAQGTSDLASSISMISLATRYDERAEAIFDKMKESQG